jgi:hypothetical protein
MLPEEPRSFKGNGFNARTEPPSRKDGKEEGVLLVGRDCHGVTEETERGYLVPKLELGNQKAERACILAVTAT